MKRDKMIRVCVNDISEVCAPVPAGPAHALIVSRGMIIGIATKSGEIKAVNGEIEAPSEYRSLPSGHAHPHPLRIPLVEFSSNNVDDLRRLIEQKRKEGKVVKAESLQKQIDRISTQESMRRKIVYDPSKKKCVVKYEKAGEEADCVMM